MIRRGARQLLSSLRASPKVDAVALFRNDGSLLADYDRDPVYGERPVPLAAGQQAGHQFHLARIDFFARVAAGWIRLSVDLGAIYRQMFWYLGLILIETVMALAIALRLQARQVDTLMQPLQAFTENMARVSLGQLDIRASATGVAELDRLGEGFNTMVEQIRERDRWLASHLGSLEQMVEQRTRELRHAKDAAEAGSKAKK